MNTINFEAKVLNFKPTDKLENFDLTFIIKDPNSNTEYTIEKESLLLFLNQNNTLIEDKKFTGELDVSKGKSIFYKDDSSGDNFTLSLSETKVLGSIVSIRIDGGSTLTIPSEWNFSGDDLSTTSTELNELMLLYVSDEDIRIINRVIA